MSLFGTIRDRFQGLASVSLFNWRGEARGQPAAAFSPAERLRSSGLHRAMVMPDRAACLAVSIAVSIDSEKCRYRR